VFEEQIRRQEWSEKQWQDFFDKQSWVFGYGLDYRVMRPFDREMTVGAGGTDNQNKPTVDYLMTFTDYTVLVEIKKPDTAMFKRSRGGRAGTWEFSPEFTSAVSQIIEQKAEWLPFAQSGEHHNKDGTKRLTARTRNVKSILVIGSREEFKVAISCSLERATMLSCWIRLAAWRSSRGGDRKPRVETERREARVMFSRIDMGGISPSVFRSSER
jgi:hypothetical protein